MALAPYTFQFCGGTASSCQLYQLDVFLGLPFFTSYALLGHMMAQPVRSGVGDFVWTGGASLQQPYGSTHRKDKPNRVRCQLIIKRKRIIFDTVEDFEIEGYDPHRALKRGII